jgi:hypothetical protein
MGKYTNRYRLKTATSEYKYNIKEGEQTATLNLIGKFGFMQIFRLTEICGMALENFDMEDQWVILC